MAFKVPRYASLPYLLAVPAGGLFLAYLYAWLHRPDYPEQYAIEDRKFGPLRDVLTRSYDLRVPGLVQ